MFVVAWIALFHYETLRLKYLTPLARRWVRVDAGAGGSLPKFKLLYPPAGWPMFFRIERSYGFAEVYGFARGQPILLDPHEIFSTRFVWYDNIRRNVLISVLWGHDGPRFCAYLRRKFPGFDGFAVMEGVYPDLIAQPNQRGYQLAYRCQ
ncbi:MAG: hypothetical protein HYZ92_00795 [Candidatus Omnitrophica bacterium]|nr:hypothetical protein [Candidatus Omnitrophota bacterium]